MATDWAVLICPLVAFGLYYNTLEAGFVYDDRRAILTNRDVTAGQGISDRRVWTDDFWGTPLNAAGSHGSYRPLVTLSFRWTAQLAGLDSAYWFHLTNVLLHCLVTAIVTRLAGQMSSASGIIRYVAGLFFAAHPVHCEAVAGLVGRADMVCSLFFLIGVSAYCRNGHRWYPTAIAMMSTFMSLLAKEYGLMLPVLCVLHDLINRRKPFIKWLLLIGWALFLVLIRLWLADFRVPHFAKADNPVAHLESWTSRTLTFLYLPVFHFGLLLHPHRLSFDWSMDAIRPITSWTDGRNVSALVFYSILIRILSIRKKTTVLPVLLMVIPFLPATNLFGYVGFVAAERLVYLPSAGFCYLIAIGLDASIRRNHRHPIILATAAILCVLSWRTVTRNGDWLNEERLYRSGVAINPPKAYGNLGVVLQESGRLTEAEWSFKMALVYRPNSADVHHNLGYLYQQQGRYQESLRAYNLAIHFRPQLAESYAQKAQVLVQLEQWDQAEQTLMECVELNGLFDQDRKDSNGYRAAQLSAALQLAHLTSSKTKSKERKRWLQLANQLAPANIDIYYKLGEFFSSESKFEDAALWLRRGLDVDPDNVQLTAAVGHALHDASRNSEAEFYFRRAVRLAPNDVSHRINLGAVLHVQGKYGEAERIYESALSLAPNHPLTSANLRRLRHTRSANQTL